MEVQIILNPINTNNVSVTDNTNQTFICNKCNKTYFSNSGLWKHNLKCGKQKQSKKINTEIKNNQIVETKEFKCKHCNKCFTTNFNKIRHEETCYCKEALSKQKNEYEIKIRDLEQKLEKKSQIIYNTIENKGTINIT